MEDIRVVVLKDKNYAKADIRGSITERYERTVYETLSKIDSHYLFINLNDVEYCNSSGLRSLVAIHRERKDSGKYIAFYGASENIQKVFKFTQLDTVFNIYDSIIYY